MAIRGTKLSSPEPIRFPSREIHQPREASQRCLCPGPCLRSTIRAGEVTPGGSSSFSEVSGWLSTISPNSRQALSSTLPYFSRTTCITTFAAELSFRAMRNISSRCAVHPSPGDLNIPARISDPLAGKMQSAKKVPRRKRVRKPFPPQKSPDKLSRNNGQQVIARLCFGSTIVDNAGPEIRKTNSRDATGIRIRVR